MHRYVAKTAGEELCQFVFQGLDDEKAWRYLATILRPMGSSGQFAQYYHHHAAVFLTCRLISAGRSRAEHAPENLSLLAPAVTEFPWNRLNSGGKLLRLLSGALRSSGRTINRSTMADLKRFAVDKHPHCYICGRTLDFTNDSAPSFFTAEHIWPSSYGGDSIEDNLLPACHQCNNRKGSAVSWVTTDVHSLFLPKADEEHLARIEFKHRYAVFNRFALVVAMEEGISLKQAFLKIGPWDDARVFDSDAVADMFNIHTHASSPEWEAYESL